MACPNPTPPQPHASEGTQIAHRCLGSASAKTSESTDGPTTASTTTVLMTGMSTFATNHMFSHAHTVPAYTDRGASGFVGRFQLPFARPLHTAAATPSAAAIAARNGITKTRRGPRLASAKWIVHERRRRRFTFFANDANVANA